MSPFKEVVQYLESLSIMPKTMPGIDKIRNAVSEKSWWSSIQSKQIITVAGTNGKGTTCAALEALLLSAGKKVGLYTSPHLIQTTERIRINGLDISEDQFVAVFLRNKNLIQKHELTHFEALTLMAADMFFTSNLDYIIFEVGLGGTYDATNVFPNHYSMITKLGMDHQNILGHNLLEIAKNKFGIVKNNSVVVHHELPDEVLSEVKLVQNKTASRWRKASPGKSSYQNGQWWVDCEWGQFKINIPGHRSCENAMTALTLFSELGFKPQDHLSALGHIRWPGRMQQFNGWNLKCPMYLSGDHNIQGVQSLLQILEQMSWNQLHLVVGIGQDKDCSEMFEMLLTLPKVNLYLTETPFKGRRLQDYPESIKKIAHVQSIDLKDIKKHIAQSSTENDLVVVTGSLYLVGHVLQMSSVDPI